jgi:BarA-like signal transduction histidine kinase
MKNKYLLTLIISAVVSFNGIAQGDDLNIQLQKLKGLLSKVSTGTKTYDQSVKPLQYGTLIYTVEETDQKGVKTVYDHEFNLADIDPYTVKQETQKDVILVSLTVRNKQKLVKVSKNSEVQSYSTNVEIRAKDIDNAREITDVIKKAIPPAEKLLAGKLKLKTYDEMVLWLINNTKNIELGTKSIKQNLVKGNYVGSLKLTEVETDAKGSIETQYSFNLADINLNSVNFKVTGNRFGLNFEIIQGTKAIRSIEAGKNSFQNELTINTNNVDEARDLKTVLSLVVPLAQEKVKADNPKSATMVDVSNALKLLVKDIKTNEKQLFQTIDPQCVTTVTQTNQTASSTEKTLYTFNWMDLNPNLTKIQTTGDRMFVEATALDKKSVIMVYKNDKFEGYKNEVNLFAEDIEVARRLKDVTDKAIEKCKASYKVPFSSGTPEIFNWLKKTIGDVVVEESSVKQSFEAAESTSLNKVKYTCISVKGNTSSEEIYEFNLSDINPATVEIQVKGKWLYVKFETNFKAKIINAYKDGKILPYASSMEIVVKDVESARGVIAGLEKCIEAFRKK